MTERRFHVPHAALHAPVADFVWSVRATLDAAVASTGRVPCEFPWPVEIVGYRPSVVINGDVQGGGLLVPTVEDFLASVERDHGGRRYTARADEAGQGSPGGASVVLADLGVQVPVARLTRLDDASAPVLGFEFSWRDNPEVGGGNAKFEDANIAVAVYFNKLTDIE